MGDQLVRTGLNSLGLGGIASFFGGGGSSDNATVLDKLDQIQGQLNSISLSIDAMHDDLKKRLDELQYNTLVTGSGASDLIKANHVLHEDYGRLINAARRRERDMVPIYGGGSNWNDIMTGGAGAKSLIFAAQALAASPNQKFYTAESARSFENLWSYFDSQQTVTLFYFIEHLNATNQGGSRIDVLDEWCQNRKKQVGMLKGTASSSTYIFNVYSDVHPGRITPHRRSVPLPSLPTDTVLQRQRLPTNPNYRALWYLKVHPPVPQGSDLLVVDCTQTNKLNPETTDDTRTAFVKVANDLDNSVGRATGAFGPKTYGWHIPTEPWLGQLIHECGGRISGLRDFGFDLPGGDLRLWAIPNFGHSMHQLKCQTSGVCHHVGNCDHSGNDHMQRDFVGYVSYNDDESVWTPAEEPSNAAMIVYCQVVDADQFLYA